MTWPERLLIWFLFISLPLLLIAFPLYLLFGGMRTFALRPLRRCFDEIQFRESDSPKKGEVCFVYHTYRGFLVWTTQDEHRIVASPTEAERLLKRLLRFNLTWGILNWVGFIPLLAIQEYYLQRMQIRQQAADNA